MELVGAIDLLGGRARRLVQGDYDRPITQSADPLGLARRWLEAGLRRLHVVDLEGARLGRPVHVGLVAELCRLTSRVAPTARVQAGGGLRDVQSVELMLDAGVETIMLGSAAISRPEFLARCAERWPGRVGLSLDLRHGTAAVEGWQRTTAVDPVELAHRALEDGAARLAVTDIGRDGTALGPNLDLLVAFRTRFPTAVLLAAGGIASPTDLAALAALGLDGAIVGRALLDGSLDVAEALAACTAEIPA